MQLPFAANPREPCLGCDYFFPLSGSKDITTLPIKGECFLVSRSNVFSFLYSMNSSNQHCIYSLLYILNMTFSVFVLFSSGCVCLFIFLISKYYSSPPPFFLRQAILMLHEVFFWETISLVYWRHSSRSPFAVSSHLDWLLPRLVINQSIILSLSLSWSIMKSYYTSGSFWYSAFSEKLPEKQII